MIQEIIMLVLKIIIIIFVPAITSIITFYFKKYIDLIIDKHFSNQEAENLKKATDIIVDSVNYVQQSQVDSLKKSNLFDTKAQEEAFEVAKSRALNLMNDKIKEDINKNYGNVDTFIQTMKESIIAQQHK